MLVFLFPFWNPKGFWHICGRKAESYTPTPPGLEEVQQLTALSGSPELYSSSSSWVISRDLGWGEEPEAAAKQTQQGVLETGPQPFLLELPASLPFPVVPRDETLWCLFLLVSLPFPPPQSWKERKMTGNSFMLHSLSLKRIIYL